MKTAHILTSATMSKLRELVAEVGEVGAAKRLGIARITIARALAGLELRYGSLVVIETSLKGTQVSA